MKSRKTEEEVNKLKKMIKNDEEKKIKEDRSEEKKWKIRNI